MSNVSPKQVEDCHECGESDRPVSPVPRASVCIPLYQKEHYIGRTVESVLAQTFVDFELVVLDNACTDGSADVVRSFDDPRIRLERNRETVPAPENFNRSVHVSRAPLVKVLNADDLIHPRALERQVAVLDAHPGVAVVSCRHDLVDDDDRVVARDRVLRTDDLVGVQDPGTVVRRVVRHGGNPLGVPGNMLFRRAAFDACGGYPTDNAFSLDVALAVRLLDHGDFYGLPETLSSFRLATGSVSSSARRRNLALQRAFVRGVRHDHPDAVGPRDVVQGALRQPLTWLRHQVLMSASTDPSSRTHRMASLLINPARRHG